MLGTKIEIQAIFFHFQYEPQISPFLLCARCKSGATFIRRSFRDEMQHEAHLETKQQLL